MIHHEIGCAFVRDEDGNRVTVERATPLDFAMAAEEPRSGDAIACQIEAAREWLAWIFESGPHPFPAMRRLVSATTEHAPGLLQRMSPEHVRAVAPWQQEKEALRLVLGATPEQVKESLSRAYRREGRTWDQAPHITTLAMRQMVEAAMDPDDALLRATAMERWLSWIWDAGPDLAAALKSLYAYARSYTPELILNMSGDEIARLFNQGRAAESARVKQRVSAFMLRKGYRHATLPFQKSVTACETYADRAKGNRNRAKAVPPAA